MRSTIHWYRWTIVLLSVFSLAMAQPKEKFDENILSKFVLGETVISKTTRRGTGDAIVHTVTLSPKHIAITTNEGGTIRSVRARAPEEVTYVSAEFKSNDPHDLFILKSNGTIDRIRYNVANSEWRELYISPVTVSSSYPYFKRLVGDALYILEGSGAIYASWDTAKTWKIDTAGLSGAYVMDIAVDTNHYGWAATTTGAFYQHPDSAVWRKSVTSPQNCQSIFIDRRNRILMTSSGKQYVSTNRGTSWDEIIDPNFLSVVKSFGDDAFGNIYASASSGAYRLSNLTPPWVKISDSLKSFQALPSNSSIVNRVSGDSAIFAATTFGVFTSTDYGTTWKYANVSEQMPAFQFNGLVRSKNYFIVCTNLGIYRLKDGDSVFTKIFPLQGFQGDLKPKTDAAGNIYVSATVNVSEFATRMINFKSTNQGTSWNADTAGLGSDPYLGYYGIGILYEVDAEGNQYTFVNGRGLFTKTTGGSWKSDTNGMNLAFNQITSVSTKNSKGTIYAVKDMGFKKFALYKRAVNGTTWQPVDITAVGQSTVRIQSDQNGDIVLTTFEGKIFRYNGASWKAVPLPAGIGGLPAADRCIVDRNGALWISIIDGFTYVPHSVQFTTDDGATWKDAGMHGVGVAFFSTTGDSVFAISYIDGVFTLTASMALEVRSDNNRTVPSYELYQNYPNPFNPTTTIQFAMQDAGFTTLTVYDILGREVATLVNEEREAGIHTVPFNASALSTGIYFYSLRSGNYTATKKLLLMK